MQLKRLVNSHIWQCPKCRSQSYWDLEPFKHLSNKKCSGCGQEFNHLFSPLENVLVKLKEYPNQEKICMAE
jgi:hypothetical protein